MDPESGLDAVRSVGINGKKVAAIHDGSAFVYCLVGDGVAPFHPAHE
jgi:hypothetical protein